MLDFLPEDCFAHMLAFTSPRDACCVSGVSSVVKSLADLDSAWEKFCPSDYADIISRLVLPVSCSTKTELFFRLCNPRLTDGGRKMISLEKSTGKKLYMLSSRELSIAWANNPLDWSWTPHHQSRFSEVELRTISWFEINGNFNTLMLSPRTVYGAYLILKFENRAHGLDTLPSEISLKVGNFETKGQIFLRQQDAKRIFCSKIHGRNGNNSNNSINGSPCEREDGWTEIELGSFYNNGEEENKKVEMGFKEVTGEQLNGGLIVEGIELRPKSI